MNKILVIQTAFIGDVILITPLLRGLRQIYPQAQIDVLVVPQCGKLLENNPDVHEINWAKGKGKRIKDFISFIRQIREIKQKGYDLSVSPHSSTRSGLLAFLAGIPHRIGFKRNLQQYLLTKSIPHPSGIHKRLKNLKLLDILPVVAMSSSPFAPPAPSGGGRGGATACNDTDLTATTQTRLYPTPQNYQKAMKTLRTPNTEPRTPIILLAPGSVWFTKRWSLENYTLLTQKLIEKGFQVILSGSPAERDLCQNIYDKVVANNSLHSNNKGTLKNQNHSSFRIPHSECIKITAGDFDLLDTAALIEKADLVICNDSGTLHIANAMNTPVFAFFGPTVKDIGYFPYRENDFVFEADIHCRPCGSHGGKRCPKKHHNCMEMIKVDTVFDKIISHFDNLKSEV